MTGLKVWLEENEALLRGVFRVLTVGLLVWLVSIAQDVRRYSDGPDIRAIEGDVDKIQRDIEKMRERSEPRNIPIYPLLPK